MATRTFFYEQGILPNYLSAPDPGVYVTWDRVATNNVSSYLIFRSDYFELHDFPTIIGPGIGTGATPDYTFVAPQNIKLDSSGDLFVMDWYPNNFSASASTLVHLRRKGGNIAYIGSLNYVNVGLGTQAIQFAEHYIDPNDILYITDASNFEVLFPSSSNAFGYIPGTATGIGTTLINPAYNSLFNYSISGYNNHIFVIQNSNIVHLETKNVTANSIEIDFVENINLGTMFPTSLTVDKSGNLYLSGFPPYAEKSDSVFIIYNSTTGYSITYNTNTIIGLNQPLGVTVDNVNNIYVANTGSNAIVKYEPNGNLLSSMGSYGTGYLFFNGPVSPIIDSDNNIYFCDPGNGRIQYFDGLFYFLANIPYPQNEVVDKTGRPSSYYFIKEVDSRYNTLNNIGPIMGEELLIRASLSYELSSLLAVPIYDEEPLYSSDRTKARVAYDNICFSPAPEVRITSKSNDGFSDSMVILNANSVLYQTTGQDFNDIMDTNAQDYITPDYPNGLRYKIDYRGTIYFVDINSDPVSLKPYDTVFVSYAVKMFTGAAMNNALMLALNAINSQPGSNKYGTLYQVPFYYDPALITGAAYYLVRQLLLSLTSRERRLLIMDPDSNEKFDPVANLKEIAKDYQDDFNKFLEKLPIAQFPMIGSISVPEYAMPGGRSRYFRYIWKGGQAG